MTREEGGRMEITERVLKLATRAGFFELFWEEVGKGLTYRRAYELVEGEHAGVFGRRRYASYESFRTGLYRKRGDNPKMC